MAPVRPDISLNARFLARTELDLLRGHGVRHVLAWNAMLATALVRDRLNRSRYRQLDEDAVRAARRSDTVFVFGSGYSLNDVPDDDWAHIAGHDTFGFNTFFYERWVPVGFHILRGGLYGEMRWRPWAEELGRALAANPLYADTVYLIPNDYMAQFGNQLAGYGLLPEGARLYRYRTRRGVGPPTRSFAEGIRHAPGTLIDAVNCAYCLGWNEIVLVGVDLYDARYFYLAPDETLAQDEETALLVPAPINNITRHRYDEPHNTFRNGVVDVLSRWGELLAADGVELSVYNPRSLLAGPLPVYRSPVAS